MTEITIQNGTLVARMTGIDIVLAARRKVVTPLAHIVDIEETPDLRQQAKRGWKLIGSYFPGWFRNGTFREDGHTTFWNVTGIATARAVTITLRNDRFSQLVLAVHDPAGAIASIRAALPTETTSVA